MTSVSVVGGGPVGLMMACLLSPFYQVTVYEKRSSYQRLHELDLGTQVIDQLLEYCSNCVGLAALSVILNGWRGQSITTLVIEQELRAVLQSKNVNVIQKSIADPSELGGDLIFACDGAHSSIRKALHQDLQRDPNYSEPELVEQHQWGHMLSLRFTTSANTTPRKLISGLIYNIPSAMSGLGLDHESFHTMAEGDQSRKVSVYLPIPPEFYQLLRGQTWTMEELKKLGKSSTLLVNHLERYRINLELRGGWMNNESIAVLPLTGYRASAVSYISITNTVFLVGDSSSGLIYRRGLKKGWAEACYLAQQLVPNEDGDIDTNVVASDYQNFCTQLYQQESVAIQHTIGQKDSVNTGLALAGVGVLAALAAGLAFVLRR